MCIKSGMSSNHLILCGPLLLPSIFLSIMVFSNESVLRIRTPRYWSFSFSISLSNEYSVLISFRMDWLDLLAVQGTLRSLLQYHSSKASVVWHSAFFMVQLSHPYMTTGKIIALSVRTCVSKVNNLRDDFKYIGGWGYIICKHNILCKGFEKLQILVSTREGMSWRQSSANTQG